MEGVLIKSYHVFTDSFYTKIAPAQELLNRKPLLIEAVNKNSKDLPKALISGQFIAMELIYYRQGQLLVVGFKEKPNRKPVFLISTSYQAD